MYNIYITPELVSVEIFSLKLLDNYFYFFILFIINKIYMYIYLIIIE